MSELPVSASVPVWDWSSVEVLQLSKRESVSKDKMHEYEDNIHVYKYYIIYIIKSPKVMFRSDT